MTALLSRLGWASEREGPSYSRRGAFEGLGVELGRRFFTGSQLGGLLFFFCWGGFRSWGVLGYRAQSLGVLFLL